MKSDKPSIAIVAGDLTHPRSLAMFEALKADFEPTVLALGSADLIDRHGSSLRLKLFDTLTDMPGYMRGLEDEIAGADFVTCVETSRLSSFQAVRAARKLGLPCGVVVHEFLPYFYASYPNIRAVQADVISRTDRLWATSAMARDMLILEGAEEERVGRVPIVIDTARFRPDEAARQKFRKYIQLGEDDIVVLYHGDLDRAARPEEILLAVALLKRQGVTGAERLKVIMAGNGPAAMELKYRSADTGLGRGVMFLHQDPEPFLADLYAASDVIVRPRLSPVDHHEEMPFCVLEAMAAGAVPLVYPGTIAGELAGAAGALTSGEGFQGIAIRLAELIGSRERLIAQKCAARDWIVQNHSLEEARKRLASDISATIEEARRTGAGFRLGALVLEVESDLRRGRESQALVRIEEALLIDPPATADRSVIQCLRGDVHYAKGNLERAMEAYTEAIKLDERNAKAYRGLGFISWQGHSHEEALTFFRKALARDGTDAETMLGIGLVYRRLGLIEEALFWLERAVSAEKAPTYALTALAQACLEASRPQAAVQVLERVMEAVGETPSLLMALGQVYLNNGQAEIGHRMLQKALEAA